MNKIDRRRLDLYVPIIIEYAKLDPAIVTNAFGDMMNML